jgi:hypothetical protein
MVEISVHRIVGGIRALIEPTLGHRMLTIILQTLLVDIFSLILIVLRCEVGNTGIDVPDLAIGTDVIAVDSIPDTRRVTLHFMRTDNLKQGSLQLSTLLSVGCLIIGKDTLILCP